MVLGARAEMTGGHAARYPFLDALRPVAERLAKLGEKDHAYLMKHLPEFEDELLTAKDDLLSPIKAFMPRCQRTAYDEAITFLREEETNFAELPAEEVQPLRDLAASPHPFRGGGVPAAKAAARQALADGAQRSGRPVGYLSDSAP